MTDAFTLHIPLEPEYRSLAPDVAGRYAELLGASPADAAALAGAIASAVDRLGYEPGAHADLAFRPEAGGVHVELSANGRRETVTVPISVARR
jgi:hypothetical protein